MAEVNSKSAKILAVTGNPTLVIRHNVGKVRIIPGSDDHITIEAVKTATANVEAEARRALETMEIKIAQAGETVRVETKFQRIQDLFFAGQRRIDVVITTPSRTNIDLNVNAGSGELEGISGSLGIELNAGTVTLNQMFCDGVSQVRVNAGNVSGQLSVMPGGVLELNVNSGNLDLTLPSDTPAHIDASANAGSIRFVGWSIPVQQRFIQASAVGDLNPAPSAAINARINAGRLVIRKGTGVTTGAPTGERATAPSPPAPDVPPLTDQPMAEGASPAR